jgi:hypothetical protein
MGRRARLTNPLWVKSPLALIRFPGLLASIVLGALLLALAAAAYPLFISASASNLLASNISNPTVTRYLAGVSYSRSTVRFDAAGLHQPRLVDELGSVVSREAIGSPLWSPVSPTQLARWPLSSIPSRPPARSDRGQLMSLAERLGQPSVGDGRKLVLLTFPWVVRP